jgi:hypothetical protein
MMGGSTIEPSEQLILLQEMETANWSGRDESSSITCDCRQRTVGTRHVSLSIFRRFHLLKKYQLFAGLDGRTTHHLDGLTVLRKLFVMIET